MVSLQSLHCLVCKAETEVYLSKAEIPEEARLYPCEECVAKLGGTKIFLVSVSGRYVKVQRTLFESIFKRVPDEDVVIVTEPVFEKFLRVVQVSHQQLQNSNEST
jgi:hypothetical protein